MHSNIIVCALITENVVRASVSNKFCLAQMSSFKGFVESIFFWFFPSKRDAISSGKLFGFTFSLSIAVGMVVCVYNWLSLTCLSIQTLPESRPFSVEKACAFCRRYHPLDQFR